MNFPCSPFLNYRNSLEAHVKRLGIYDIWLRGKLVSRSDDFFPQDIKGEFVTKSRYEYESYATRSRYEAR
jgi:hypothetical protein